MDRNPKAESSVKGGQGSRIPRHCRAHRKPPNRRQVLDCVRPCGFPTWYRTQRTDLLTKWQSPVTVTLSITFMSWPNSSPFVARLVCPAVIGFSLFAAAQDASQPKTDLDRLQGEWAMVVGTANGQDMPEHMLITAKRIC